MARPRTLRPGGRQQEAGMTLSVIRDRRHIGQLMSGVQDLARLRRISCKR